jgi:glycosyltransferase involved in cell wall biosynthesis
MRTSVLVVSAEPVGDRMAGPAIRAYELARALAARCDVTLAAPAPSAPADPRLRLLDAGMADVEALVRASRAYDVVVAQELPPVALERLAGGPARLVADLYNPVVVEALEGTAGRPEAAQRRMVRRIAARSLAMCAAADLILCANERQRDLWIGALATHGLVDVALYRRDPALRSLVAVVPFGVPDSPAPKATGAIRSRFPAIGATDAILLWGGGVWSWLDPGTPLRAVELLTAKGELGHAVHLVVLGTERPDLAATGQAPARDSLVQGARRAGLLDRVVHINSGWVPYDERGAWLAEADLAVSAHRDHLETRYAHRARLLDALWAGVPVVTTRGDTLAELIERERLGEAVPPGDAAAFAAACERLLGPDGAAARSRIAGVAPSLRWSEVTRPLVEWCAVAPTQPRRAVRRDVVRRAALTQYAAALPETLAEQGASAAARRVGRRLRRAVRLR